MSLSSGTRLGPYEILAPLGAGGMGEVYRARDTRLDRSVAIKILPAQFSSDAVRKQRFEREAKTISSLNHPHVSVLYDVGSQDGIDYLVMECVEGETLDHETLAGQRAFAGKSQLSVASAILEKEPAPIRTIKPLTPRALDHTIRRCLEKEPEKRWQSAADLAGAFDLKRLEATGRPTPILEGVVTVPINGGAQFSFSESGNIVYIAGRSGAQNVSIDWMDHDGKFWPLRETPGDYYFPAFSPDGKRLALTINDAKRGDIWVYEWEKDILTRLTFADEQDITPAWTPDGQRIVYPSLEKGGTYNIWWKRADGAGDAQRLTESKYSQSGGSWRPDGKVLAFAQLNPGS